MAAWGELLAELNSQAVEVRAGWLDARLRGALQEVGKRRGGRNVLFYSSAFLQKPQANPAFVQITHEDINGFMSTLYGMKWEKNLTLILHTPGGVTNATETIVDYLHQKFAEIEVIIPTFAMSAGTMISLASNRIIMGRQSQLGPIDPQLQLSGKFVSARAIVEQFKRAKEEIGADLRMAHVWAPILQTLGPALLIEAENALQYGERMVGQWLRSRMLAGSKSPSRQAKSVAKYFNDAHSHKSHGRRINRDEARSQGVVVDDLEVDQKLQDEVLTAYHLMTIMYEQTPAVKMIFADHGQTWIKNA